MSYKAFYRRYRPNRFNEVIGQEYITKSLINLIKMNKISHAYLFCGPKGTGKTSVARIFANTINCIHSDKNEDICENCLNNAKNSLDIIEIDAASNNSVNDVRNIREQVKFAPTNNPYKIYIIDEVHMLTHGAFNALLRTLEEPPKHVIFIFATTDPDKIPETILSRVQRYNFKRISKKEIIFQLKNILDNENIKYDDESLDIISNLSNGSLRDALSLTDQTNAYTNSNINQKDVIKIFGISSLENQINFINMLAKKNISESLQYFDQLIENGIDISKFLISLIELLKNFIIFDKTNDKNVIDYNLYQEINKIILKTEMVYKILDIWIPLLNEIKHSDIPNQLMHLSIIKICSIEDSLIDIDKKNITNEVIKNYSNFKNIETETDNVLENQNLEDDSENEENNLFTNEYKDITNEYFSLNKTTKYENSETKTSTNSILNTFDLENVKKDFNELVQNFSLDNQINDENDIKNKIEETLEKKLTKLQEIESKNENKINYDLINKTTEILNISNENEASENEINEALLNNYDTSKQTIDTNEIDLSNANEEHKDNYLDNNNNNKNINNKTKDFDLNLNNNEIKKLSQPFIINLFLLSKKETFEIFKQKLEKSSLTTKDSYETYSVLIKEAKFVCSSNDFILVSSEEDWVVDDLTNKSNEDEFKNFVYDFFGNNVHFYAINKNDLINTKMLFNDLKKSGNVPKAKPLEPINNVLNIDKITKEEAINQIENKSKNIFGSLFSRKKN